MHLAVAPLLASCAAAPVPAQPGLKPPAATRPGELLGSLRATVEARYRPLREEGAWVSYAGEWSLRYDAAGVASALRATVPDDVGCKEAARWLGFRAARAPMMRGLRCRWPYDSPQHGLGPGVYGHMGLTTRVFVAERFR